MSLQESLDDIPICKTGLLPITIMWLNSRTGVAVTNLQSILKPMKMSSAIYISGSYYRAELVSAVNVALSYSPQCIIDQFIPGREAR